MRSENVARADERLAMLQVPGWQEIPGLVHGFFGRKGGVSHGPFAELNLSSCVGDDSRAVRENWRRIRNATKSTLHFVTMHQVHGDRVVAVDRALHASSEADGLLTSSSGVGLGVLTADCVPILFLAPQSRLIAAVHAGWRGTLAGIVVKAVDHMREKGRMAPSEIRVALGPAIGGCCYDVDDDIARQLESRWGSMADSEHPVVLRARSSKVLLDLRRANAKILTSIGITDVQMVGPCTRCSSKEYFSYRSASGHSQSPSTGRQLSFIGWEN